MTLNNSYEISFFVAIDKGILMPNISVPFVFETTFTEKFRDWIIENEIHYHKIEIFHSENVIFDFTKKNDLCQFMLRWC